MTRALTNNVIDARIRQAAAWGVPAEEICARHQLSLQRVRRALTGEASRPCARPNTEAPVPAESEAVETPESASTPTRDEVARAVDLLAGFGLIVETRAGEHHYRGKPVSGAYVLDMAARRLERAGREA